MTVEPRGEPWVMCFPCSKVKSTGRRVPTIGAELGGHIHIRRSKDPDAGTDFLIAGDARAAAVYLFFEKLPDLGLRDRIPVRRIEKLVRGRKEVQ